VQSLIFARKFHRRSAAHKSASMRTVSHSTYLAEGLAKCIGYRSNSGRRPEIRLDDAARLSLNGKLLRRMANPLNRSRMREDMDHYATGFVARFKTHCLTMTDRSALYLCCALTNRDRQLT